MSARRAIGLAGVAVAIGALAFVLAMRDRGAAPRDAAPRAEPSTRTATDPQAHARAAAGATALDPAPTVDGPGTGLDLPPPAPPPPGYQPPAREPRRDFTAAEIAEHRRAALELLDGRLASLADEIAAAEAAGDRDRAARLRVRRARMEETRATRERDAAR